MTPKQIMEHGLQDGTDVFAIATIVRTAGTTAAKHSACCAGIVYGRRLPIFAARATFALLAST